MQLEYEKERVIHNAQCKACQGRGCIRLPCLLTSRFCDMHNLKCNKQSMPVPHETRIILVLFLWKLSTTDINLNLDFQCMTQTRPEKVSYISRSLVSFVVAHWLGLMFMQFHATKALNSVEAFDVEKDLCIPRV